MATRCSVGVQDYDRISASVQLLALQVLSCTCILLQLRSHSPNPKAHHGLIDASFAQPLRHGTNSLACPCEYS